MEQVYSLSGAKLTIENIAKLEHGAQVAVDPEVLESLAEPSEWELKEFSLTQEVLRSSAALGLNSLLRHKDKIRKQLAVQLTEALNTPNFQEALSRLQWSEVEFALFSQTKNLLGGPLGLCLFTLKAVVPLQEIALSFEFESMNLDASIVQAANYKGLSSGSKTTYDNLETLLQDSKLAKKQPAPEEVSEAPLAIGNFRDLLEQESRAFEREVNTDLVFVKKQTVQRGTSGFVKAVSGLQSLSCYTLQLTLKRQHREDSLEKYLTKASQDLLCQVTSLNNLAKALMEVSYEETLTSFEALKAMETRINENSKKPRALQLGKGTRQIYQYLKDQEVSPVDLSLHINSFLTSKNEERRVPKLAKGMRDFGPEQMAVRELVFGTIKGVFKKHMAGELETPVMELRETLTNKYGDEGAKLIYNLEDQGGELLSLRYDLTVPFARYIAMNRISKWKRFQIGKVYRRDQPQMKRGRFREFYQCDFDIVGPGSSMLQDAEVLKIVVEILQNLGISFLVKVNHRKLLDAVLEVSGCPPSKFRTISSSIDKLDKEDWSKVKQEMITDKGLSEECSDLIGEYVKINGKISEVVAQLKEIPKIQEHEIAAKTITELERLGELCESLSISEAVVLDLSLARGLDYYTGLVYEAVLQDSSQGVGSIAGGGRYDELIMKLSNSKSAVPAVGVSLGVERLLTIVEERYQNQKLLYPKASVLVAQAGTSKSYNLLMERVKICNALWDQGITAETSYKEKSEPKVQAGYASEAGISWIVWVGESELDKGVVRVKHLASHTEEEVEVSSIKDYIMSKEV